MENEHKNNSNLRSTGEINVHDPRGYSYIPRIVRKEVGLEGKGKISFFLDANVVLLIRQSATKDDVLKGLEVLKQDLQLRWKEEKNHERSSE